MSSVIFFLILLQMIKQHLRYGVTLFDVLQWAGGHAFHVLEVDDEPQSRSDWLQRVLWRETSTFWREHPLDVEALVELWSGLFAPLLQVSFCVALLSAIMLFTHAVLRHVCCVVCARWLGLLACFCFACSDGASRLSGPVVGCVLVS